MIVLLVNAPHRRGRSSGSRGSTRSAEATATQLKVARFAGMFGSFPTAERVAFNLRSRGSLAGYSPLSARRYLNLTIIAGHGG
jgi:hypothetical protein